MIGVGNKILIPDSIILKVWDTDIVEVTNPTTGRVWMDRNIGATRAATSSTDSDAYGHLFQWGRGSDGHELRTSSTTITLSTTDVPGHDMFIRSAYYPYDWRDPQNSNLWQSNIEGNWRLPTKSELDEELGTWATNNRDGAYGSVLKLPVGGRRMNNGTFSNVGIEGYYWSRSAGGDSGVYINFGSSSANTGYTYRGFAYSVRLIKDEG